MESTRVHGTLAGVGVGPGHYELVTVQAADLLAAADIVFVLVSDNADTGQAERLALFYAEAWRVERLELPQHGGTTPDTAQAWAGPAQAVADWFAAHPGGVAAVAVLGDPALHSAFPRLVAAVRERAPDVSPRLVPGIMPMQEVSALVGAALAGNGQSVAVLPAGTDAGRLRAALRSFDTVVVNKVGGRLPALLEALRETGRLHDAVLHSGGPFTRAGVRPVAELGADEPCRYLSTLVVLPAAGSDTG
jgi:precorrin-2/cobalt-factor-2 C20-methyltransferase